MKWITVTRAEAVEMGAHLSDAMKFHKGWAYHYRLGIRFPFGLR